MCEHACQRFKIQTRGRNFCGRITLPETLVKGGGDCNTSAPEWCYSFYSEEPNEGVVEGFRFVDFLSTP
eukprot:1956873-Amphidinium_carterae.1